MSAIRRRMSIQIDYVDEQEMIDILIKVINQRKNGYSQNYIQMGESNCQWEVDRTIVDYREEEINGVWCQVYQSKMNRENIKKQNNE